MIKAIFFDIDGTLVSTTTHKTPQSTIEAVKRVRSKGIKTFLCTSRARHILSNIPPVEYDGIVCLTGAHLLDDKFNDIHCSLMDPLDVAQIVADAQRSSMPIIGHASKGYYSYLPMHSLSLDTLAVGGLKPEDIVGGYLSFPDFNSAQNPVELAQSLGIMQITGLFPSGAQEREKMKLMPHSHPERWCELFVDIIANGIDKAVGITRMCEHFGIDISESMAIGDGANDIPMLKAAGIGIAMGNALDIVKSNADYVTDTEENEGLSKALQHFLPE